MNASAARPVPVLVVDDDSAIIRTLADILRIHGFAPDTATSATEGLEIAQRQVPALAIVDLRLPDMDGLELAARLHKLSERTEVVILTGNATMETAIAALHEHSLDFLLKPVDVDDLLRVAQVASERWRRQQTEDRLAESNARFRQVFESAMIGMTLWRDETLLEANDAFLRIAGYDRAELDSGMVQAADLIAPEYRDDDARARAQIRDEGVTEPFEAALVTKSGDRVPVLVGAACLEGTGGDAVAFVLDISDRKRREQAERHSERMEAMGRVASTVAHDFNNLLTVIGGFAETMKMNLPRNHESRSDVDEIMKAVAGGARLTRQLMEFGRARAVQPGTVPLNNVVQDMKEMVRRLAGPNIEVRLSLDPRIGEITADRGQLEQVVLNLCVNARDAMPAGGELTLETSLIPARQSLASAATDAGHAMLAISDTGHGMSEATQRKIFEPFFTTKMPGKGTGLGLATVHEIVTRTGGTITVRSALGQGTRFTVLFPLPTDSGTS